MVAMEEMVTKVAMEEMGTKLCAPLVSKTVEEMLVEMESAKKMGADIVEIRLDHLTNFQPALDLPKLLNNRLLPAIITYRPNWEGGEYEGDDKARFEALHMAMRVGADYIDIELKVADEFFGYISGERPESSKLIVSSHNYKATPSSDELSSLIARIQAVGADIVKIVTFAVDITDVSRMFQMLVHCHVPIIGLCMSERGLISRLLCSKFGGFLTFGSVNPGRESAPGQPTIKDLLDVYNIRQLQTDTRVFGLIGKPVAFSKSPIFHNAVFKAVGFNAIYVPLLVDDIASFLEVYSSPDFAGFSCTKPHKETAVGLCDEVDPVAKSIGAVNTIIRRPSDGKLIGYNTDYIGAISAIEDGIRGYHVKDATISPLAGRTFVVVGAGGAGRALAYGAKQKGAKVVVANRTYAKAKELAKSVGGTALTLAELEAFYPEEGMILANTTSLGMFPNAEGTPIHKDAEECGVKIVSGVEMFIRQAMGQFELFTGMPAPVDLMRDILTRIL